MLPDVAAALLRRPRLVALAACAVVAAYAYRTRRAVRDRIDTIQARIALLRLPDDVTSADDEDVENLWVTYRLWVDRNVTSEEGSFHALVYALLLGQRKIPAKTGSDAASALSRVAAAGLLYDPQLDAPQRSTEAEMVCWLDEARVAFDARLAVSHAVRTGDAPRLAQLLDDGAIAHPDDELPTAQGGEPALHVASGAGHAAVVALLIERGASVLACASADGYAPIHAATMSVRCAEVLSLVLAHGASVHTLTAHTQATALHVAAYHGRHAAVKFLVARGADVRATDAEGRTPLDHARSWLAYQLGGCPCSNVHMLKDPTREWTSVAATLEQLEAMAESAERVASARRSWALHVASALQPPCERGDVAELDRLLACYRQDVDAADYDGSTALHAAAQAGHADVVLRLLDSGAAVDAPTRCGDTPLHLAAGEGHLRAAEALVERGAAPEARTIYGATPLVHARRHQSGQWAAVAELLERQVRR